MSWKNHLEKSYIFISLVSGIFEGVCSIKKNILFIIGKRRKEIPEDKPPNEENHKDIHIDTHKSKKSWKLFGFPVFETTETQQFICQQECCKSLKKIKKALPQNEEEHKP